MIGVVMTVPYRHCTAGMDNVECAVGPPAGTDEVWARLRLLCLGQVELDALGKR